MRINTGAENRKNLIRLLSLALGEEPNYNGPPSYSYNVGASVCVERDGTVVSDDLDAWERMMPVFVQLGCVMKAIEERRRVIADAESEHNQSLVIMPIRRESVAITVHNKELTPRKLLNLIRLLYARQDLIRAMLDVMDPQFISVSFVGWMIKEHASDTVEDMLFDLSREIAAGHLEGLSVTKNYGLKIQLRYNTKPDSEAKRIHEQFLRMVVDHAMNAKRIRIDVMRPVQSEMKFYCHGWLRRIGAAGDEYAKMRDVLLGHLDGWCTFKNADKMHAHVEKTLERRRAEREKRRKEYVEPEDFVYDDRPSRAASRR